MEDIKIEEQIVEEIIYHFVLKTGEEFYSEETPSVIEDKIYANGLFKPKKLEEELLNQNLTILYNDMEVSGESFTFDLFNAECSIYKKNKSELGWLIINLELAEKQMVELKNKMLNLEVSKLSSENQTLKSQLDILNNEIAKYSEEVNSLNERVAESENLLSDAEEVIQSLRSKQERKNRFA